MKMVIKNKEARRHITLYLPLSFIETSFAVKMFNNNNNINFPKDDKGLLKEIYKILKAFLKTNGHFNLVCRIISSNKK